MYDMWVVMPDEDLQLTHQPSLDEDLWPKAVAAGVAARVAPGVSARVAAGVAAGVVAGLAAGLVAPLPTHRRGTNSEWCRTCT